jgi:hypothetical protein
VFHVLHVSTKFGKKIHNSQLENFEYPEKSIGKFIGKRLFYGNLYRLQPVLIVLFSHVCPAIVEIAGFFCAKH